MIGGEPDRLQRVRCVWEMARAERFRELGRFGEDFESARARESAIATGARRSRGCARIHRLEPILNLFGGGPKFHQMNGDKRRAMGFSIDTSIAFWGSWRLNSLFGRRLRALNIDEPILLFVYPVRRPVELLGY